MAELSSDMLNTILIIFDMFGLKKIIVWIIAYYNMLSLTTVLTIIGMLIALVWMFKEFSKTKNSFDPRAVDRIIDEQKGIIRHDQAENVV